MLRSMTGGKVLLNACGTVLMRVWSVFGALSVACGDTIRWHNTVTLLLFFCRRITESPFYPRLSCVGCSLRVIICRVVV